MQEYFLLLPLEVIEFCYHMGHLKFFDEVDGAARLLDSRRQL